MAQLDHLPKNRYKSSGLDMETWGSVAMGAWGHGSRRHGDMGSLLN